MVKHLILMGVLLSWIAAFFMTKLHGTDKRTLSQIGSQNRKSYLLFALGMTLSGVLTAAGVFFYLVDALYLGVVFVTLYGFIFAGQMVAAWVGDSVGVKHKVHFVAAWVMSYLFLPVLGILAVSVKSNPAKITITTGLLAMVFLLAIGYMQTLNDKMHLKLQMLYFVLFQLTVLAAVYIR